MYNDVAAYAGFVELVSGRTHSFPYASSAAVYGKGEFRL